MSPEFVPAPLRSSDGVPAVRAWSLSPRAVHLNHGSFGAVPRAVQEAQNALRAQMDAAPVAWFASLPDRLLAARERVADLLGVDRGCLAWVGNATAGATAVFRSLGDGPGGDVLVTDHGYGAVTFGAGRLARRWGGDLVIAHVPLGAGADEVCETVLGSITARTKLLVLDHITSATARGFPAEPIAAAARERGVRVLVDGAHVPGLYDGWADAGPWDYWVGNLHKFACAPRGAAVLLAAPDRRADLYPVVDGWGTAHPFPQRFDSQGTSDLTSYLTASTAWELIEDTFGWGAVRAHQSDLADYGERVLAQAFTAITGQDHRVDVGQGVNAMRLVRLPAGLAASRVQADELRDRFVSTTGSEAGFTSFAGTGYLRISTAAYTTADDIDRFAEQYVPLLATWARESC